MKIKKLLIIFTFILNFVSVKAFIVKLEALEKLSIGQNQIVIKAGDAHFGCQKNSEHPTLSNLEIKDLNKKHALSLANFSNNLPKNQCLFILEDMYHPQGNDKFTDNFFSELRQKNEVSNFTNCMGCINDLGRTKNLNIENIEFRHSVYLYAKGHILTIQFLDSIDRATNEIRSYDDQPIANDYYKNLVNTVLNNNKEILNLLKANKDKNIDQIEDTFGKEPFRKNFNNFVFDYYLLVDAKIIHTILKHKDKKYIIICAGNNHLERIDEVITPLYKQKFISSGNDLYTPANLQSCLDRLDIPIEQTEFPAVSIFIILLFVLSISFPRRFRILHLHSLQTIKMEKIS